MKTIGLIVLVLLIMQTQACNPFHGGGGDHCDHAYRKCLDGCARIKHKPKYYGCQAICFTICKACKS